MNDTTSSRPHAPTSSLPGQHTLIEPVDQEVEDSRNKLTDEQLKLLEQQRELARACLEQQTKTQWSAATLDLRAEINRGNWHQLRETAEPSTLVSLTMHFMHLMDRGSLFPNTMDVQILLDALQHIVDTNTSSEGEQDQTMDKEDKLENPPIQNGGQESQTIDHGTMENGNTKS